MRVGLLDRTFSPDVTGMRSIPQSGHCPGSGWRIWGCIEHVQMVCSLPLAAGVAG